MSSYDNLGMTLTSLSGLQHTGTQGNRWDHLETNEGRRLMVVARLCAPGQRWGRRGVPATLVHDKEEEGTH